MATPRLLAILWADLVDSTETVAKLGPDAGEAWRQRFLAAMREALAAARRRGLLLLPEGTGVVVQQVPAPQVGVARRTPIRVRLETR